MDAGFSGLGIKLHMNELRSGGLLKRWGGNPGVNPVMADIPLQVDATGVGICRIKKKGRGDHVRAV